MNLQFKDSVQDQELDSSISFHIHQASFAENRSNSPSIKWARIAPNKVIVANSDCTCLLEDNNQFHFT